MKLYYTLGSPFARIVRVLLRELFIECEEIELSVFPPQSEFFKINPLGQVPALEAEDGVIFPTRLIIDRLLMLPRIAPSGLAGAVRSDPGTWQDEQVLAVLLSMGDALVAIKYQAWAGLRAEGENLIGYDPAERHSQRVASTLDWLEDHASSKGFLAGTLSIQDIALSCLLLWTDARGGFAWRNRPKIEAIVSSCAVRPSFLATAPQPWP